MDKDTQEAVPKVGFKTKKRYKVILTGKMSIQVINKKLCFLFLPKINLLKSLRYMIRN